MSGISYYVTVERESGNFELLVDYYVDVYNDPETGESFGDTSWGYSYVNTAGQGGGTGGWGSDSATVPIYFGFPPGETVEDGLLTFTAMNQFSGASVSQTWRVLNAGTGQIPKLLNGGSGVDIIAGGYAGDTLYGLGARDYIDGGAGDDLLYGGDGEDLIFGGDGDDRIGGGANIDHLFGGAGNDRYLIDTFGDTAFETVDGGNDIVTTRVAYSIDYNVEIVVVDSAAGLTISGNEQDNRIYGGNGGGDDILYGGDGTDYIEGRGGGDLMRGGNHDDKLIGGEGADTLYGDADNDDLKGDAGDDTLYGGLGNDHLNGGAGVDAMEGGAGDDIYVVDDAGDGVTEAADGGTDLVTALIDYTLGSNVEKLLMMSDAGLNGTGNGLDNKITGANGGDVLNGEGGSDVLIGGLGADMIFGGTGADLFQYRSVEESAPGTSDILADFNPGEGDRIDLGQIDARAGVNGNNRFTWIGTSEFTPGAKGQLRYQLDDDQLMVLGEVNGDGVADLAIIVRGPAALGAEHFVL